MDPEDPPVEPPTNVRTLSINGMGTRAAYSFAVSGEVLGGTGLTSEDSFEGNTATGAVRNGTDQYQFTGNLNGFELRGGTATADINGTPVTVADPLSNTLTIRGTGTRADYTFTVDGALEAASTLTSEDSIDGSSATGAVRAGSDSYFYSGSVTEFSLDGEAEVLRNGSVDPDPTTVE